MGATPVPGAAQADDRLCLEIDPVSFIFSGVV